MTAQPFPDGAVIRRGRCGGVFCRDAIGDADVVDARVGPTWREAMPMDLCAECLADFAVANVAIPPDVKLINVDFPGGRARVTEIPRFRVYVKAAGDGLYHEVTGELTADIHEPEPE
jgi:hypothetical protein